MCALLCTLQWQDADAEVFQLAEGADEVQLVLDGRRTVCDQLETRPDEDNNQLKQGTTDQLYWSVPEVTHQMTMWDPEEEVRILADDLNMETHKQEKKVWLKQKLDILANTLIRFVAES